MNNRQQIKARIVIVIGLILILVMANTLFGLVWPPLLTKAGSTLPPRHAPAPGSSSESDDDNDDKTPVGAHIELHVEPVQVGLWTVVQWQDSAGNWHDVDGWRGTLETGGYKRWWVAYKDFGAGPFRWLATRTPDGPELVVSEPFSLPPRANEIVQVSVSLRR